MNEKIRHDNSSENGMRTQAVFFAFVLLCAAIPAVLGTVSADTGGPDIFGYSWIDSKGPAPTVGFSWVEINSTGVDSGVTGDDVFGGPYALGFTFDFYGNSYTDLYFNTNGLITFGSGTNSPSNTPVPSASLPHDFIAAFWDDLAVGPGYNFGAIYYEQQGLAPNRQFIVEWCNITTLGGAGPMSFEVILNETGQMWIQYDKLGSADSGSATVGIENFDGTDGLEYCYDTAGIITNNLAVMFSRPSYDVSMTPGSQSDLGDLGAIIPFNITVMNTGTNDDTYDLSASGNSWTTVIYDATGTVAISAISVPSGSSGDFTVKVTIPGVANPGDSDEVTITATSQNDTLVDATATLNTTYLTIPTYVAVFRDADPWGFSSVQDILTAWSIPFDMYASTDIGVADLSPYDKVIIPSDQPQAFYDAVELNLAWFDSYVTGGGILQFGAGSNGWNGGSWNNVPGGYTKVYNSDNTVTIDLPAHPFITVPNTITDPELDGWGSSTHAYFGGLPPYSVTVATDSNGPCVVESVSGLGRYFAYGLIVEWGWGQGYSAILENIILCTEGWATMPAYAMDVSPGSYTGYNNPGSTVDYVFTVTNSGTSDDTYDLSSVTVWPIIFRDIGDTIDITSIFVTSGTSEDFISRVSIPGGALPGEFDVADIDVTSQADPSNSTDSAQVSTQVPYPAGWFDTFDGGWGAWNSDVLTPGNPTPVNWEFGDPLGGGPGAAYNGTNCSATNIVDSYYPSADITLTTPYVELGAAPMILSFYNWYQMDTTGDDGGFIEISVNNGPWNQIWPVGGYPWVGGFMGGYSTDGYSGNTPSWEYEEYDLSGFAGQTVRARFHFAASDWWGWQWGWYVDDVYMGSPPPYELDLLPVNQDFYGIPGASVDYIMTIDNTGTSDDTYDITASGNVWPVVFRDIGDTLDITSIFVSSGTSESFIARVSIPGVAIAGDFDTATVTATSQGDPLVFDDASIRTQVPNTVAWFDGFEGGWGAWSTQEFTPSSPNPTNWEMGDPLGTGPSTAYNGGNCSGTNIVDWYYVSSDTTLITPYVQLGVAPQIFSFFTWYTMNTNGDDGGFVEISVAGGPWNQITPIGGYPWVGGMMGGYWVDGYSGISSGWEYEEFDFDAYAGQVVQVRFHYAASDWWGWQWGWYVDDAYMGAPPPYRFDLAPVLNNSFGSAGTTVDYVLSIDNTGTSNDIYDLTSTSTWPVVFRDIGDTTDITTLNVNSGATGYFIARVSVPGAANPGDIDSANITVTSQGDPSKWHTSTVTTGVSLSPPWLDDFEFGIFGGSTGLNWTKTVLNFADVGLQTAQSGIYSMYTCGGIVEVTSIPIDMSALVNAEIRCWIQRGDDIFSEDPDSNEDLIIEYLNDVGTWIIHDTYLGSGTAGQIYTPIYTLAADALHNQFQLRFRQTGGSGASMDYWHIDDVYIGAPLGDITPPADITDLAVSVVTDTTATLTWTAPGDDGMAGTAAGYEVRYSTIGIIDAGNWGAATTFVQSWTPQPGGNAESHDVTGLVSGTQYWFAMVTRDEVPNWSGISNSPTGTTTVTDVTPPSDITDLAVSVITDTIATLTWTAPGDDGMVGTAAGYEVRYSTVGIINAGNWGTAIVFAQSWTPQPGGNVESHDVTGLVSGTQYWFALITRDEVPNWSGISNSPTGTTTVSDVTPPADITNLGVFSTTSSTATLTWTAPGDDGMAGTATGYEVRYSTVGIINAGNWGAATTFVQSWTPQPGGNAESHDVTGLASGTQYWFAIMTRDEVPNWSGTSNSPTGTTLIPSDVTPPADISDLVIWGTTSNTVTLTWTSPGDDGMAGTATGYEIRYSTAGPITDANWGTATVFVQSWSPLPGGNVEMYDVTGLSPSTQYWFAVRAADEEPNWSGTSNSPSVTTDSLDATPPDIISDLTVFATSSTDATLTWTAPGDDGAVGTATNYEVRYSTTAPITDANWASATMHAQSWTPQLAGNTETYIVTGLTSGTQYWFAVRTADEVPNWAGASNSPTGTTLFDNIPPSVSNIRVNGQNSVAVRAGADVILTANINDESTGNSIIAGANYTMGYQKWPGTTMTPSDGSLDTSSETVTHTIETAGWNDGTYRIYINAWDDVPNHISDTNAYVTITIDSSMPASSIDAIASYWHTVSPLTITATASDSGTGLDSVRAYYRFSSDNTNWGSWVSMGDDPESPWEWDFDFPSGDGHYQFRSRAVDIVGNTETGTSEDAVCGYDSTEPRSTIDTIAPFWQVASPQTITASVSDVTSGKATCELFYRFSSDNFIWGSWVSYGLDHQNPWNWDFDYPSGEGYYQFYTTATDIAGNEESGTSGEASCGYDVTPPVADAGSRKDVMEGTTVSFDGTGSSDNIGIQSYEWKFTDGDPQTLSGESSTYTFSNHGNFLVTLTVTDHAGHSSSSSLWVSVDPITDPTTGMITGLVRDDDGHPLVGAIVSIPDTPYAAVTDETGHYTINQVPPGNYDLTFRKDGFESGTISDVGVSAGQETTNPDFILPKGAEDPKPVPVDYWWLVLLVAAVLAFLLVFGIAKRRKREIDDVGEYPPDEYDIETPGPTPHIPDGQPYMAPPAMAEDMAYPPPPDDLGGFEASDPDD
jgi:uncharacterized membrane protein